MTSSYKYFYAQNTGAGSSSSSTDVTTDQVVEVNVPKIVHDKKAVPRRENPDKFVRLPELALPSTLPVFPPSKYIKVGDTTHTNKYCSK